jgi:hypothetical protein
MRLCLWGRLAVCGGLAIRLLRHTRMPEQADSQSAAASRQHGILHAVVNRARCIENRPHDQRWFPNTGIRFAETSDTDSITMREENAPKCP